MEEIPIYVEISSNKFLDIVDRNCVNDEVDKINKIFISNLKDIFLSHYMDKPRSMLCRKLERNFIEEEFGGFDYNFLPNCFRHLGFQPRVVNDIRILWGSYK